MGGGTSKKACPRFREIEFFFWRGGERSFQQDHGQPLIFATFHQGKVGSAPDLEESMQWKIAKEEIEIKKGKPHGVHA
ncbi:MAG: hypothetical protein ACJAZ2_000827 [Glaciecola sp.]